MADKNQAVIDFLLQCPTIQNSPLYFNFINAKDNNKQLVTQANDKALDRPYIDGSVLKRYTFTIIDYRSINALAVAVGYANENVEEMLDVQSIIDWVTEQNELRNYPNFGEDCVVEELGTTTDNPNLNGINSNVTPALAIYSISIHVDYIDNSKKIWR